MYHYAPPNPLDRFRPRLEAPGHGIGPGPLSPAWPKPVVLPPPVNEWEALVRALEAIRDEARSTLRPEDTLPFFLSVEQRRTIEDGVVALKRANREVMGHMRWREVEEWPTPLLPTTALFGARDLLPILSTAIRLAAHLIKGINYPCLP